MERAGIAFDLIHIGDQSNWGLVARPAASAARSDDGREHNAWRRGASCAGRWPGVLSKTTVRASLYREALCVYSASFWIVTFGTVAFPVHQRRAVGTERLNREVFHTSTGEEKLDRFGVSPG
jgi:hypothetical protein